MRPSLPRIARMVPFALALTALPGLASAACPKLLDHPFQPLIGSGPTSLCKYAGKVVLVVNTASRCAYTPQYQGLDALYREYGPRGLVVVGFPSNDFGGQEPGSAKQIADFCETTYGVKFPLHAKTQVRGGDAHPLYRALSAQTGQAPGWNFHKYLIDRQGKNALAFASDVRPDAPSLTAAIERLIADSADGGTQ